MRPRARLAAGVPSCAVLCGTGAALPGPSGSTDGRWVLSARKGPGQGKREKIPLLRREILV